MDGWITSLDTDHILVPSLIGVIAFCDAATEQLFYADAGGDQNLSWNHLRVSVKTNQNFKLMLRKKL